MHGRCGFVENNVELYIFDIFDIFEHFLKLHINPHYYFNNCRQHHQKSRIPHSFNIYSRDANNSSFPKLISNRPCFAAQEQYLVPMYYFDFFSLRVFLFLFVARQRLSRGYHQSKQWCAAVNKYWLWFVASGAPNVENHNRLTANLVEA